MNEAHAILPFLIFGGVLLAGVAIASSAQAKSCPVPRVDFAYTATSAKFKNKRLCNDMPRNYEKRIKLVSNQYKPNMKFNQKTNTSYRYDESCVSKFNGIGRPKAVQLCKCIHKKQQRCAPNNSSSGSPAYGWNMLYPMAEQTCMTAFQYYENPCPSTPTTTDTPTPTTNCGKTGTCKTDDPPYEPPVYDTPTPQPDNYKTNQ